VPILAALAVLLLVIVLGVVLIPISLVQRYRVGTSRQRARGWLATTNVVAIGISTALYLAGAAVTTIWVPRAFPYALAGLAAGALLGLVGLALTRWERGSRKAAGEVELHFTPNRWLVLAILLAVVGRIAYSFWRAWESWQSGIAGGSWVINAGAAESLAAGAVVLGYYLTFWSGVRRRIHRHRSSRLDSRHEEARFSGARPVPTRPGGRHG
jgi:hypothetical protein